MVQGLGVWLKNAGPMAASLKISDWIFFYLVQLKKEDRPRVMLEITLSLLCCFVCNLPPNTTIFLCGLCLGGKSRS